MSGRLPQSVQPERLAETVSTLRGSVSVSAMTRLAGYLRDTKGSVEVELAFGVDEQGVRYARGHLQTELHLVCQRCLQSLTYPMNVEMTLGFVRPEAAMDLPDRYEPLVFEGPMMDVTMVVEDELILALPIVPMHALDECRVDGNWIARPEEGPEAEAEGKEGSEKRRPFAGLADLMKK